MEGETFEAALLRTARDEPERLFCAFGSGRVRVTYGELHQRVDRCTAALNAAGVGPGVRVALRLPPSPELLVHLLAVIQAGGLAVPLAVSQHPSMTELMQRTLDPHLVVAPAVAGASAHGMAGEPGCEWIWQPSAGDTAEAKPARLGIFTSGSTGAPRCALLSLSNLRAGADFVIRAHDLDTEDCALGLMPLHHINGIVTTVLAPLLTGGAVVFLPGILTPLTLVQSLEQWSATWFNAAPIHYRLLLHGAGTYAGFPHCRFGRSASAALPVDLQQRFEAIYGIPVVETMGLSECSGQVFANPMDTSERRLGSVGRAVGNRAEVVDELGRRVPNGTIGEIRVSGPNVMLGYLGAPAETDDVLRDGWLYTGDLGYRDVDGFFWVTGRRKLVANVGGHKVSLVAVENAASQVEFVAEAAAVARPDPGLGEVIDLYYAGAGDTESEAPLIRAAVVAVLPHHLALRRIRKLARLPRSDSGKVLRHRLAEEQPGD